MLEDSSYLVPRDFPRESKKWSACMNYNLDTIEVQHDKRPLENNQKNEVVQRKMPKLSDALNGEVGVSSTDDQSGNHHYDEDNSPLIPSIGQENSISALIHYSRSDYGAIASLNCSFGSLLRSGELYRLRYQLGVVEHWVYFFYHLREWEALYPSHHHWMHLPSMNFNECFVFLDKESLAVGIELLVFG